jgi:hypothetical protein
MTDAAVATLVDRLAIHDVLCSYAAGVDRRDWEVVESCFTADAYVEGSRKQARFAEYFPFLRNEFGKFQRTTHFLGNHRSAVDGDRATAETYAVAMHFWTESTGEQRRMAISVRYADDLVRADGWRIAHRRVAADWIVEAGGADIHWTLPLGGPA